MPRLAIINDYQQLAMQAADWSSLPDSCSLDVSHDRLTNAEEAAQRLAPYDIVITAREETRFDNALIERLPNLKLLITHGMQNAALDMAALRARGISVCGTGYGYPMGTVELTWGLILSLVKHIPSEDTAIRQGHWGLHLSGGLTGKTLGIVGLGELGSGVARVGLAFDMQVIAWSQNLTRERCEALGVELVDKQTLFERADVVSVHLKLSERSRGIVGATELGWMKPDAMLINTSRGPVVDENALVAALREGRIGGAGLDVFDTEPLPTDHVLRGLPNTVLTPHIGGRTRENFLARYADCLEDVKAWLAGAPVRVLNP
ncbi:MAG: D-2-hydroxyacid dehydrogenase family protein [Gammaproteobacteria bacterium]|nr:D-2-hydroxyacid dehydrogenase family protein [Gammaproteobacteria bacterium]